MLDTLTVGDCVEVMASLPVDSVDLTITSPPYDDMRLYEGYRFDARAVIDGIYRVTKPGGVCVWVVNDKIDGGRSMTSFRHGLEFVEAGWTMHDIMIYAKTNTPFPRSNAYTPSYEFMFVASIGKPKTFNPLTTETQYRTNFTRKNVNNMKGYGRAKRADGVNKYVFKPVDPTKPKRRNNIWFYGVGLGASTPDKVAFEHPAIFPDKLARDHILSWSNEGDVVMDPMCGSGTTPKQAHLHGRHYIGIDVSERYIEIARARLAQRVLGGAPMA